MKNKQNKRNKRKEFKDLFCWAMGLWLGLKAKELGF